jgi:hypothetical protein
MKVFSILPAATEKPQGRATAREIATTPHPFSIIAYALWLWIDS